MPREFPRRIRVAEGIKRSIAPIINDWMRENEAGMASVTDCVVSSDMKQAKLFVSFYGCDDSAVALKALNDRSPRFRQNLARELRLRSLPAIKFLRDDSIENGDNITQMLDSINDR